MADTIDAKRLPKIALVDSSVVIPAYGPTRARTSDNPACKPFCDAMVDAEHTVLIAAPTLTEYLRGAPATPLPHTRFIQVVAFDTRAAELLATKFPPTTLVRFKEKTKRPIDYIKYDALIAACALRHRADVFVTADTKQRRIAEAAGLVVKAPSDYWAKQTTLPHT